MADKVDEEKERFMSVNDRSTCKCQHEASGVNLHDALGRRWPSEQIKRRIP